MVINRSAQAPEGSVATRRSFSNLLSELTLPEGLEPSTPRLRRPARTAFLTSRNEIRAPRDTSRFTKEQGNLCRDTGGVCQTHVAASLFREVPRGSLRGSVIVTRSHAEATAVSRTAHQLSSEFM